MKRWLHDNGLTLVLLALFLFAAVGQAIAGVGQYNEEQQEHQQSPVTLGDYVLTAHYWEALSENWESEFLQMAVYVILTAFLFQRGSSESKDPDKKQEVDEDPRDHRHDPDVPAPVRYGGLRLRAYEQSLSITFVVLFLLSFLVHGISGTFEYNDQQAQHGAPPVTVGQFMVSPTFWFQSFQNWQSEFFAVAAIVVLSIFLRQRGSPESKPVHAPHRKTGETG
ncbi:MAG TPA: DUF6766 family protein [Candidatus Thermoplasmatota archaeon]|nr:DUF6766 family protein [Candidatus Thermoplasmatota archaeon]